MIRRPFRLQASFVATGNRTDISLEDPDFWQKWAKKAELDLDAMNGRVGPGARGKAPDVSPQILAFNCANLQIFKRPKMERGGLLRSRAGILPVGWSSQPQRAV